MRNNRDDLLIWKWGQMRQQGVAAAAKTGKGGTSWSTYWSTRTPTASILTVLSDTSIKLDWTNGADEDYDGLRIYSSTDGVTFAEVDTVAANIETYTATGLTHATLYYFYVEAYKDVQISDPTLTVSLETIYLPTDIANIFAWYDANQLTGLSNNDDVASFTDFGGSNRHLTQATADLRPHYITNVLNGKPAVRTDGSNDWMRCLSLSMNQPQTIYLCASRVGGAGTYYTDFSDSAGRILNNSARARIYSGANLDSMDITLTNGTTYIYSVVLNGASSFVGINGGYGATGNAGSNNGNRIHIGSDSTASAFSNVDYFDIIIYNGAHDANTRRKIEMYLANKYGLELEPI